MLTSCATAGTAIRQARAVVMRMRVIHSSCGDRRKLNLSDLVGSIPAAVLGSTFLTLFVGFCRVPQSVHFLEVGLGRASAARRQRGLDCGEATLELGIGAAQRDLGIDAHMAG